MNELKAAMLSQFALSCERKELAGLTVPVWIRRLSAEEVEAWEIERINDTGAVNYEKYPGAKAELAQMCLRDEQGHEVFETWQELNKALPNAQVEEIYELAREVNRMDEKAGAAAKK